MSNITDILYSAQDGQLIANLAQRFGLSDEQMDSAVRALAPALAIGLRNASADPNSLEKVIGAINTPQHLAAFDNPDAAHADDEMERGRETLADLFGSSAAAGQVVQVAARESGLRPDILNQLLPVLVSVVLGGLFKSFNNQGLGSILGQLAGSGGLGSILEQLAGGRTSGGGPASPTPAPAPAPMPRGGTAGSLGGLLGGLLGALLGGRRAPPPGYDRGSVEQGGGMGQGGATAGPAGLPPGLDQASLEAALEQIKKTLQPGPAANAGGHSELEDIIGQVFGPGRR